MKSVDLTTAMVLAPLLNMDLSIRYHLVDEDGTVLEEIKTSQLPYLFRRKRVDKNGDVYYAVI